MIADDFGWDEERFLSFLPLSAMRSSIPAGFYLPIGLGAEIWFAEGLDKLSSNIEEARPTIMVVVPRLFEVLRGRIIKPIEKQGRLANFLLDRALALGERQVAGQRRLLDMARRMRCSPAHIAPEDPATLRRADQGAGFGRCAAQSGSRRLLRGDGPRPCCRAMARPKARR